MFAEPAMQLAEKRMWYGDVEGSIEVLDEIRGVVSRSGGGAAEILVWVDFLEALAHLQESRTRNCVADPGSGSCLLFGGEYDESEAAEEAIDLLEADLDRRPEQLPSQWLLNLLYAQTGRYPDDVPRRWRLDLRAFSVDGGDAPRFRDVAPALGLASSNLVGGAIMDDFDGDGLLDVLTTTYEPCSHVMLYRNEGDGSFRDVSLEAGLETQLGGFNTQQTDFDNDGDLDVFITRGAWQVDSWAQAKQPAAKRRARALHGRDARRGPRRPGATDPDIRLGGLRR